MWFGYSPGSTAGVGLLIAPQLRHHGLNFALVNERVIFPAPSVRGQDSCCCLCLWPNRSTEYPHFSESLRGTVDSAQNGDPDFSTHVGNNSDNWRGRIWNDLPNLNPIVFFCWTFVLLIPCS